MAHETPPFLDPVRALGRAPGVDGPRRTMLHRPPIFCPLPDVADHVLEAGGGGGEGGDGGGGRVAVLGRVGGGELAGPDIGEELIGGVPLVAPGIQAILLARSARHL